jgi:hypothetical protein
MFIALSALIVLILFVVLIPFLLIIALIEPTAHFSLMRPCVHCDQHRDHHFVDNADGVLADCSAHSDA